MRRLNIIPIIHSKQDLGSLEKRIDEIKAQHTDEASRVANRRSVDAFWQEVRQSFESWEIDSRVVLYQDALPHSGHPQQLVEHRIVEELASKGNANHQLLKSLIDRGAKLVGTESIELLIKEYEAVRRSLAEGDLTADGDPENSTEQILEQRDRYIAKRIDETLAEGQTGVLFIGLLHRVEEYLPSELAIEYPFGRPSVMWLSSIRETY